MSQDGGFLGWDPTELPIEGVDWSYRGEYIRTRSKRKPGEFDVEPEWATEAVMDEQRILAALTPPASPVRPSA